MSNYRFVSKYPVGQGGWLDSLWGGVKDVGGGVLTLVKTSSEQKGAMDAYRAQMAAQQGQMPGWILPVALGGGALALILLLKKRKS